MDDDWQPRLYSGQTLEELIALGRSEKLMDVVDLVRQGIEHKVIAQKRQPSLTEATLTAIPEWEGEVYNGGFAQALVNSSERYADRIVAMFKGIGCVKKAELSAAAMAAVPGWKNRTLREMALRLDRFDHPYYRLEEDEDIYERLFQFVVDHADELSLP